MWLIDRKVLLEAPLKMSGDRVGIADGAADYTACIHRQIALTFTASESASVILGDSSHAPPLTETIKAAL